MIEVVTAGLDWLTLTLGTDAVMEAEFVNRALKCLDTVVSEGHQLEYRDMLGYRGVGAGGCFVGTREDTHMVQMSGRYAHQFFGAVYRPDAHVSRADIQVTVKHKHMPKRVAKEAYKDAITSNNSLPVGRRRKVWIIVGSDGGDTCYIGSSSSDARGRLYNKEVQSEDPLYTRCWRYEVMLRNDHATNLCRSLQARIADYTQFCSDYVAIWYEKRGITIPWIISDAPVPIPPIKTLPTDIERKQNWLKHQVRPTVEYLLTVADRAVILELLGLS
jgi:DNA relaxase NicK